ncbi:NERD domain-containing protein [Bacillus sp. C11]|nr:NERD domain-containing protein [Neobacillus terrae]
MKGLSSGNHFIFHGLRLGINDVFFQIDKLIVTSRCIFAIEVKNRAGELHFDKSFNQLIVKNNDKVERRKNPVLQVQWQSEQLKYWLEKHHFPNVPIEFLFVNANDKAILSADPGYEIVFRRSCNSDCMLQKVNQFSRIYKEESLSPKDIRKLSRQLLNRHTPLDQNLLEEFHIPFNKIKTGAMCPNCGTIPMSYKHKIWTCANCGFKSSNAYLTILEDYFLLIKKSINNAEFKKFANLLSYQVAYRFLASADLASEGKCRGRTYHPK